VNRQMEDVIRSLKGRVEDGSRSDGGDEEDQDQSKGLEVEEAVDTKLQAHLNERPLNADQEKSINELHNKMIRMAI